MRNIKMFESWLNESLTKADFKINNTYLIKKGSIEAYAEYKNSENGINYFDNSGELIQILDNELSRCVFNEDNN